MTEHHALDDDAIVDLFHQAISWAKTQGIAIRPGSYGAVSHGSVTTLCPISAVLLRAYASPQTNLSHLWTAYSLMGGFYATLAQRIGRSEGWVLSLQVGFDIDPKTTVISDCWDREAVALGRKLRTEVDAGIWS